jgi:S-adenosylmethionine-diacylglycerol 3-amino-3-carboxypropyl transferase
MLKFAVVREDFAVEAALVETVRPAACLTVASGGCTALALKHAFPSLDVHAFDLNPDQLAHARRKADAIADGALAQLNVANTDEAGLSQCGEFEKLFRVLRFGWQQFVAPGDELETFFSSDDATRGRLRSKWLSSPSWPAIFEVAFAEGLLHAMFGPDATRHAVRGSYPSYFQRVFERGLQREDAASNPWLQHVLLQRYVTPAAFLISQSHLDVSWHLGSLGDVPSLERFGVVSLSNIFDWSDASLVEAWAKALLVTRPGTLVVWRQLNNQRDWRPRFHGFEEDEALSARCTSMERALFYERLTVMRRR